MSRYFETLSRGVTSVIGGLGITLKHFANATNRKGEAGISEDNYFAQQSGLVSLQYPSETIPTPSFARYRLHNDGDDCIACNQCARACPVQCITIDSFKATPDDIEELGLCSDGTKKKLWLPVFDIDMAKCMYCGLCTYPCPTECLTMTPVHDFSEYDRSNFIYHFGTMTNELAEAKKAKLTAYDAEQAAKKAAAPAKPAVTPKAAPVSKSSDSPISSEAATQEAPVAESTAKKLPPMMAAKMAAAKKATDPVEGSASTSNATDSQGNAAPEKKLSPMMAAKLAAKKATESGDTPKSEAAPTSESKPSDGGEAAPAKKISPMMAAKLAAKKAAENED
ncbi:MAG: NADH-quinone oxidoreductase subunit I [Chloroherpetonaceae bacterium]|nr:NADH-quinone oxidoreductase subunit I [Chloroherpetonaceae bacterium]